MNASANDLSDPRPTSMQETSVHPRRAKAGNRLPALLQAVRENEGLVVCPLNCVADLDEYKGGDIEARECNKLTEDPVLLREKMPGAHRYTPGLIALPYRIKCQRPPSDEWFTSNITP